MPIFIKAAHYQSKHYFHENRTPLRQVEYYELEWVEQGNGFSFLNGEQFAHHPQRLILARPGMQRFTVGTFSCHFVHFHAQSPQEDALLQSLSFSAIADEPMIKNRILELQRQQFQPGAAGYFAQHATLCTLLSEAAALLSHQAPPAREIDPHFSAVISAKEYIDHHFGENIHLDMLAEHAHLSRNFFRTRFSQIMGLSPREYLSQVRLTFAKKLLRSTAFPLAMIAEQCGYESQAYFTYVFKQQTGQTPLGYRKEKQNFSS